VTDLTIKLPSPATGQHSCGLCGRRTAPIHGPSLCLTETDDAVCQECGMQHAPALAALVDLARVAHRVGRINRHTLVPSFNELLDLARAAENYSHSSAPALRKAS
jgi:hypothetical protein